MKIEINIARLEKSSFDGSSSYRHFFATTERSITDVNDLKKVLPEIRAKFPEPEYSLSISVDPEVSFGFDISTEDTDEDIVKEILKAVYPGDYINEKK